MPDLNDDLMRELLNTFRYEAAEHIEEMNKALLEFERSNGEQDRATHIQNAFRAAHSLKGAARAVSLNEIQTVAHAMETVFQQARDNANNTLDAAQCDLLYDGLDIIQQLLDGKAVDETPVVQQLNHISQPIQQNGASSSAPSTSEPATPPDETASTVDDTAPREATNVDQTIRVSLRKLDDLMAEVGELLVSRISTAQRMAETRQISQRLSQWSKTWTELKRILQRHPDQQLADVIFAHADMMHDIIEAFSTLEQSTYRDVMRLDMVTNNLQDKVRQVRMIPFQVHALALERVVRDAARAENKTINFQIVGSQTELDKKVLELLKDPLIHLLRNAVGHGIETVDTREANGKPTTGEVRIIVQQRGSEVHITVSDDGSGFNANTLQAAYVERYGNENIPESWVGLAFASGVTTSATVNEISGRGVGLDVVREELDKLHGRIQVNSTVGEGASITLIVPTSLAITRTLLVESAGYQYAVPLLSIEKIVAPDEVITLTGKPLLRTDGRNIPLASLAALLEHPTERDLHSQLALVLSTGDETLGVLVDDVITEQELAVKPLSYPIINVNNIIGAALLGNGQPVIVLNPAELINTYQGHKHSTNFNHDYDQQQEQPELRVLVVDDSITTRTLERNILEAAGFTVYTATNGQEALNQLDSFAVDVVVSDIEMPHMNGFELTEALREHPTLQELPIIL